MSKYNKLWEYISLKNEKAFTLSFDEAERIAACPIDHSFLKYKSELLSYGYSVGKISLKGRSISFEKI